MKVLQEIIHWAYGFFESGAVISNALTTPIFNGMNMLALLAIGGLLTYLAIAVVKWTLD